MTPPFEHTMNGGDIIRIKPKAGKSIAIKATSTTDAAARAKVIPFKDGRPLKQLDRYNNFAAKGTLCTRRHETAVDADEFVVHVDSGAINTTAKWLNMHEKAVAAGEEFRFSYENSDNVTCHMVNTADDEAVVIITFFKDGTPLSEDDQGLVKWRTITLKEPGEIDDRTISNKGDEVVFKVEKGSMLIKLGQFDAFEF